MFESVKELTLSCLAGAGGPFSSKRLNSKHSFMNLTRFSSVISMKKVRAKYCLSSHLLMIGATTSKVTISEKREISVVISVTLWKESELV